jgi:hypothetical protein
MKRSLLAALFFTSLLLAAAYAASNQNIGFKDKAFDRTR